MRLFDLPRRSRAARDEPAGPAAPADRDPAAGGRHRRPERPDGGEAAEARRRPESRSLRQLLGEWSGRDGRRRSPYASPTRAEVLERPSVTTDRERRDGERRDGPGARDRTDRDSTRDSRDPARDTGRDGARDTGGDAPRETGRHARIEDPPDDNAGRRDRIRWSDVQLTDELPHTRPRSPEAPYAPDGRRHCGALEGVLFRQWDASDGPPPPETVRAVDSLAELPDNLKEKLAGGLDAIYVGPGGVPELDDMQHLRGVELPSGKATWDICAGAYGDRKIVVGDRPSPTPDVMFHEVGHALDDIDGGADDWQSDSAEFRALYQECLPHLASDFHRQAGDLGRREFFADAFSAIASRQRPALVDMLGGDTRRALGVMLFFNRRYGI